MNAAITVGVLSRYGGDPEGIGALLSSYGVDVRVYPEFSRMEGELAQRPPSVVVVDADGRQNAWTAATRVRARSPVGIIMLTADPAEADRLLSLSLGIDYYLPKPVNASELRSMVFNLARRTAADQSSILAAEDEIREGGNGWVLHADSWQLVAPNNGSVTLSSAEYRVLRPLVECPGEPLAREAIYSRLGKRNVGWDNRSLDVLLSRLRNKVQQTTGLELPIRSARGVGYVFTSRASVSNMQESSRRVGNGRM